MRYTKATGVEAFRASTPSTSPGLPGERFTRVFVSVDATLVLLLAFAFAFGNGWQTAKILGINPWIAPLIQPAVDLAVVGLMVGVRYLAIHGWTDDQLAKPRRWLKLFGGMTLAMNTALPLQEHRWGRASWDAVGPVLLIAWSELAPWLLRAIYSVRAAQEALVQDVLVAPVPEPQEAPEEVDIPSAQTPPERPSNVITLTSTSLNPRQVVCDFLKQWDAQGKGYADGLITACEQVLRPVYQQLGREAITRRRVGQLCQTAWDDMFEEGVLSTPRSA